MAKFVTSNISILDPLRLHKDRLTQVSVKETYDIKVWPVTNISNDGPITFVVPPQPKGMLYEVFLTTKVKLQKDGDDITEPCNDVSIVNNFSNSLWSQVDVQLDDRTDITQSMKHAYAYQSFFNHALNSESNRTDYLLFNERFMMDEGKTKTSEENVRQFWVWNEFIDFKVKSMVTPQSESQAKQIQKVENSKELFWKADRQDLDTIDDIAVALGYSKQDAPDQREKILKLMDEVWIGCENLAASERSRDLNRGESLTLCSKLQCPIFNTGKCLPTNMNIKVTLNNQNSDKFLILSESDDYSIKIEDCYLQITYWRPYDIALEKAEKALAKEPAPYTIEKPEIILKPIVNASQTIRVSDIFNKKLPSYAFFCLQNNDDYEGNMRTNPFTFIPFKKFQFYRNGVPFFKDPLELTVSESNGQVFYSDFGDYLRQLYSTVGKGLKGDCLINSKNFLLHFMVGMSFGADRSTLADDHLNLQEHASTYLEIDMGTTKVSSNMVLLVYALYDQQIQIDQDRAVHIVE